MNRYALASLGLAGCLAIAAGAAYILRPEGPPVAFCKDLAEEKSYTAHKIAHYATLIPGKNGLIFRVPNDFRTSWDVSAKTRDKLLTLQNAMKTRNADLIIVFPPVRGMAQSDYILDEDKSTYGYTDTDAIWNSYEAGLKNLRNAGIQIAGIPRTMARDNFFYKRNHHWSAEGARAAAEQVAMLAKALPAYANIPKESYKSVKLEPAPIKSSYDRAFQRICGTSVPLEVSPAYETVAVQASADKDKLFGQVPEAGIALVGTSNSVEDSSGANFEGFLKEALSANVINFAVTGAGIDTGMSAYLDSEHYKSSQPKIVIWEIPGYYDLGESLNSLYEQIMPAALGSCAVNALLSQNYRNVGNNGILYASVEGRTFGPFNPAQDPRQAPLKDPDDLYLHLKFAEPVAYSFGVKFHWKQDDGKGVSKIIKFENSARQTKDSEFFTAFPKMKEGSEINKIRLSLPEKAIAANLSMQICPLPGHNHPDDDESM